MRGASEQVVAPSAPRRHLRIRPAYIVLAVIMALFAYKFLQRTQQIKQLSRQQSALQAQNHQLQQANDAIRRNIGYYQTLQYVENQARQELGLTKPGEIPVQILPPRGPQIVSVHRAPPAPLLPPKPTWEQWWSAFFG